MARAFVVPLLPSDLVQAWYPSDSLDNDESGETDWLLVREEKHVQPTLTHISLVQRIWSTLNVEVCLDKAVLCAGVSLGFMLLVLFTIMMVVVCLWRRRLAAQKTVEADKRRERTRSKRDRRLSQYA
jgi:hypothetical protein